MAKGTCSIEGCDRPVEARGWCTKHRWRWRANGNPLVTQRIRGDDETRVWSKVNKRGPDECWPWMDSLDANGYGHVGIGTQNLYAHRVVYEMVHGPIPEKDRERVILDHRCHDPNACAGGSKCLHRRCCNPNHLEMVTHQENMAVERAVNIHRNKTHCANGHEYTPDNTYVTPSTAKRPGRRTCRTCAREHTRRYRIKKESAV